MPLLAKMNDYFKDFFFLCSGGFIFLMIYIDASNKRLFTTTVSFLNNNTENGSASSFNWLPKVIDRGNFSAFRGNWFKDWLPEIIAGRSEDENSTLSDLESHMVPLRGIGDSFLPFERLHAPKIQTMPERYLFEQKIQNFTSASDVGNPPIKKILFWNDFFGSKNFAFGFGREPFLKARCRVNTCVTTGNRRLFPLEEVDAVIWHVRSRDHSLPPKRSPHTRYVFFTLEAPPHMFTDLKKYKNVFNWTLTYRLDSDVLQLYNEVYRRRVPGPVPKGKNYASGKTKLAAWFVSNCVTNSGRETLVRTLRKWIKIDIYGNCGPKKCPRGGKCHAMLQRDYKFYLSFENSLCQDYATEKLFGVLGHDVVPVVYGLGNYSAILPPGSYIDALDFPTAKALAAYLLYLDRNDTAYNEYFSWKPYHHLAIGWDVYAKPYCDLCERLHNDHSRKAYDIDQWFINGSKCMNHHTPEIDRFIHGLPYIDVLDPKNVAPSTAKA